MENLILKTATEMQICRYLIELSEATVAQQSSSLYKLFMQLKDVDDSEFRMLNEFNYLQAIDYLTIFSLFDEKEYEKFGDEYFTHAKGRLLQIRPLSNEMFETATRYIERVYHLNLRDLKLYKINSKLRYSMMNEKMN